MAAPTLTHTHNLCRESLLKYWDATECKEDVLHAYYIQFELYSNVLKIITKWSKYDFVICNVLCINLISVAAFFSASPFQPRCYFTIVILLIGFLFLSHSIRLFPPPPPPLSLPLSDSLSFSLTLFLSFSPPFFPSFYPNPHPLHVLSRFLPPFSFYPHFDSHFIACCCYPCRVLFPIFLLLTSAWQKFFLFHSNLIFSLIPSISN